jgi:hypothetical protein
VPGTLRASGTTRILPARSRTAERTVFQQQHILAEPKVPDCQLHGSDSNDVSPCRFPERLFPQQRQVWRRHFAIRLWLQLCHWRDRRHHYASLGPDKPNTAVKGWLRRLDPLDSHRCRTHIQLDILARGALCIGQRLVLSDAVSVVDARSTS